MMDITVYKRLFALGLTDENPDFIEIPSSRETVELKISVNKMKLEDVQDRIRNIERAISMSLPTMMEASNRFRELGNAMARMSLVNHCRSVPIRDMMNMR